VRTQKTTRALTAKELSRIKQPWYESTLLWGASATAISLVLAVVAAMRHDLRWLLFIAWPFSCAAIWAIAKNFNSTLTRRGLTVIGSILLACGLGWLYASLKPEPSVTALPDPLVRVEPEHGSLGSTNGSFTLTAVNDGVDIDQVWVTKNYFVAQNDGKSICLKNILSIECTPDRAADILAPAINPSRDFDGTLNDSMASMSVKQVLGSAVNTMLRTNQQFPIAVTCTGWVQVAYQVAKASFQGRSLLAVRIILAFRRFSDQKEFKIVRVFEISDESGQGIRTLWAPSAFPMKQSPSSTVFTIEDVIPYLQSTDHWSGLRVRYKDGKPVSAD
jgi:hypothetical protein